MPNWASGTTTICGKKESVKAFCEYFLYYNEKTHSETYFARSFVKGDRESTNDIIELLVPDADGKVTVELFVDYAWSANSCVLETPGGFGYATTEPETCLIMPDVARNLEVSVEIRTEECGMGFREHIHINTNGEVESETQEIHSYFCVECEDFMSFSDEDEMDVECPSCGAHDESGFGRIWQKKEDESVKYPICLSVTCEKCKFWDTEHKKCNPYFYGKKESEDEE